MAKTYVLDGNSLLFRCFYATFRPDQPIMTNKAGVPTNAIFGFAKMVGKLYSQLGPNDRMIVCFDTGKPTFRSKELAAYKAQRKPIDPNLKAQIPVSRELLDAMGIDHAELLGYEGDDVAGSLAKYAESQGDDVVLFTSDKDFLQLIDDRISVHALKKGLTDVVVYDKDNVKSLFGCRADQVVDFKAIAGDPSDNYKGIPHIGEKTALKLLSQYDHLDDILKAYQGKSDTALARNLNAGAKEGQFCHQIATIITNLDVKAFYDQSKKRPLDTQKLIAFYQKYDLHSLIKGLESPSRPAEKEPEAEPEPTPVPAAPIPPFPYESVSDLSATDRPLGLAMVLNGDNESRSEILGIAILLTQDKAVFVDRLSLSNASNLKAYLENPNIDKSVLDGKTLIVAARRLGIETANIGFDFLLASYLLDSDRAEDLSTAFGQLNVTLPKDPIAMAVTGLSVMAKRQADLLAKIQAQEAIPLLKDVEIPLAKTLADIETEGMPLNAMTLAHIGKGYSEKLAALEDRIHELAGKDFNVKSPRQVADVLFNDLGLPRGKKETGSGIEVLMAHYSDHPIVPLIVEFRTYSKIVSGYIEALPKHICPDGKIHAIMNQTLTSTGRLSCSEPNLQNISIRKEEGKEIRKAFYYDDPQLEFLSLDYSQVELRVLAALGHIKELLEVCNSGEDIHKATAAKVFNVPVSQVTDEMRRKAKTVNFGIVYGISPFGLKERLGIPFGEAKALIDSFKSHFDGLSQFEAAQIAFAREHGYVTTVLNRRRYFPDINSPDRAKRAFSERAAVNAVIQGSAADLIKTAMNKVQAFLVGKKSKIIMQIHDELVFKLYKDEENLIPQIADIMDHALPLPVALNVDGHTGHSWFDCK